MKKIPNVIYSLYASSYAAVQVAHLLPDTDICEELKALLMEQCSIIAGVLEGDRFLDKDIENFIAECEELSEQAERFNALQE